MSLKHTKYDGLCDPVGMFYIQVNIKVLKFKNAPYSQNYVTVEKNHNTTACDNIVICLQLSSTIWWKPEESTPIQQQINAPSFRTRTSTIMHHDALPDRF